MYPPNLKSVALPVSELIAIIEVLGVANPQSWGRGGRRGSALVPFERALMSSYGLSIVTFRNFFALPYNSSYSTCTIAATIHMGHNGRQQQNTGVQR